MFIFKSFSFFLLCVFFSICFIFSFYVDIVVSTKRYKANGRKRYAKANATAASTEPNGRLNTKAHNKINGKLLAGCDAGAGILRRIDTIWTVAYNNNWATIYCVNNTINIARPPNDKRNKRSAKADRSAYIRDFGESANDNYTKTINYANSVDGTITSNETIDNSYDANVVHLVRMKRFFRLLFKDEFA